MKLRGWYIDGFGVFRDYEVTGLSDGLTIVAGPNEAGKSTLLAFLRGMLFGFPDGRSRALRYPPLRGGKHGGRLTLSTARGDYTVERHAGERQTTSVTLPGGRPASDLDLAALLGGADDRLFRSVFAFSLTELQSFETLSAEGVRDRIFSAGIAGAGRSARDASRELRDRAAALLKPRGHSVVSELVRELEARRDAIEQAQRAAIEYADRETLEEECRAEIERLTLERQSLQQERERAALLLDLWPLADELRTVTAELEALDAPAEFPDDGEARLVRALHDTSHAQHVLDELRELRAQGGRQRDAVTLDAALPAVADDVEALHERLLLHQSLQQQLPSVRQRVSQAREALDDKLARLGPDWNAARVAAFDGSIPQLEEVREWQRRLDEGNAAVNRARAALDVAATHRDEARQSRDRLRAALSEDLPDAETLEAQAAALRRVRATMIDLAAADAAAAASEQRATDRARARSTLEAELAAPLPAWLPWAAGLAAAIGLAAAGWLAASAASLGAVPVATAGLLLGILAAVTRRVRRRQLVLTTRQSENLAALTAEHAEAGSQGERWRARAATLREHLEADAAALNLAAPPSSEAVEERYAALEHQKAERLQWSQVQARLREAEARLEHAIGDADRTSAARIEAEQAMAGRASQWTAWKRAREIPESLSPQGVLDYFETVRVCRGLLQSLKAAEAEAGQLAERIGIWSARARAALVAAGMEAGAPDDELIERLVTLRRRCRDDRSARAAAEGFDRSNAAFDARLETATSSLARCCSDRDRLFHEVGAHDEASFRARLAAFQARVALRARRRELDLQLTARVGRGPGATTVRGELASGDVERWRREAASATAALEEVQRRRDQAVGAHRDAQRARLEIESSADIARLETEAECLQAELEAAVQEWRTATLARALIDDTLREFERTRQPAVLAEASRTFAFVTQGRYERIVQDENARDIAVLDRRSGRRPVDALSRGTAEQLYLCIRLALASEFAARSEPLPFVMDDVLVNFDPERARAVAEVVADFARSHQVLAFTCHPSTRDLLLSVYPQAGVVELQQVEPLAAPRRRRTRTRSPDASQAADTQASLLQASRE